MKKILLFIILAISFSGIKAQVKIDLDEYIGRYVFPEGNLAEDAIVSIINDSTLNISASIGECDLRYMTGDTFSLPQYGGQIVFIRNEQNKIESFKISIPMAGIEELEAHKEVKASFETHGYRGNRGGQQENTITAMNIEEPTLEMDLQIYND